MNDPVLRGTSGDARYEHRRGYVLLRLISSEVLRLHLEQLDVPLVLEPRLRTAVPQRRQSCCVAKLLRVRLVVNGRKGKTWKTIRVVVLVHQRSDWLFRSGSFANMERQQLDDN